MARQVVDFFRRFYRRVTSFSSHLGSLSSHQVDDEDGLISQSREWLKMKTELKIRQCTDLEQFYQVVSEAFEQLFPEVQYTCVFINDDGLKDSHGILFPDDIFANKLIGHRELVQNSSLAEGDKIYQLLVGTVSADILNTNGVSYLPIFTSGTRPTLSTAVLFVSQEIELDAENKERIELLKSSISHVRMSMLSRHHASTVTLIADMCTIGNNIAEGQMAVVLHLKRETQASSGFLLAFSQFDDDFVLKAVDNKLIPEKRFPCQSLPTFQSRLSQVKPSINSYTGAIKKDIVAVGGRLPASQCIIAPVKQNTQIIAFVVLLSQTESFTEKHLEVVDANLSLTGSLLYKDMAVERERTLRHQTEKLHQVAKNIFTHLDDLTILLKEIMQEARNLCHAEKCSVFLLENDETELVAKVFDGDIASHEEVRISATEGVAGHVVQTGKILNIKDAYSHPLFYRGVDESTGFRTRCILCFPIKDEKDVIIGAAQLCNKTTGPHFDSTDEVIAKALATYCCISIVNSLMYKDVLDAHNRVKLANELMIFHMHVPPHEVVDLINKPLLPLSTLGDNLHLHEFERSLPRSVEAPAMPSAVISMLHELEFTKTFRIKSNTLARFVLMVRKGYRDPPYHNWSHAFSVAHFAYLLLKNLNCISDNILNELEALAFFVASLCHDIDHRGTSNSFQVASNSVLAALYSSEGSVMERHHFSQTLCLLNTEGCNIFESVSRKEYQQLLDLIRDIILSTDIAHHLRIRGGLEGMAECGFDKTNPEHKSLLLCLFMTSADLADQTKPWAAAKRVSKMLYKEFFSQGDLEKALGRNPVEMMDRERASIPDLQIGFIDHIVLPAFSTLCTIFPTTECLVNNIRANRDHWATIKNKTADRRDSLTSLDVFDFIDEEDERTSSGEEAANDSQ